LSNILLLALCFACELQAKGQVGRLFLRDGWRLQSSATVRLPGDTLSTSSFTPDGWYAATVPSTVAGALVEDKVYAEPFFGMNLLLLPGMNYPPGGNYSDMPMPPDSPFRASWWYRKEFQVSPPRDGQVWLDFEGINYRANIWLNGKRLADTNQVAGAYRTYEFNITDAVLPGKPNVLAVEVFAPEVNALAITWVDWNPAPPDKNMGLWRDVYVTTTGPVALRYPQVVTKLDLPSLDQAHLTVRAELHNAAARPVKAALEGMVDNKIAFQKSVELAAHETKEIALTPDEFPGLNIRKPRLWWPAQVGPQNLHDLSLQVKADGRKSDQAEVQFGIREATSELNAKGYREFKINGQPILIRGGGWAPDLFLRPSANREIQEIRYVKDLNLNTIRFEGKTESDRFLDLCDREGIMVIAGWCCCDYWEKWSKWKEEDYRISTESLRDQIRRIRNHPSVITWWNGSDNPPNARAAKNYLSVLQELHWPNSVQASASAGTSEAGEATGMRMTGPYQYVPPVYWYVDRERGGAYSFNTETSAGPAIPPVESLRRMLPPDHLWPIDEAWRYHAGGGVFTNLAIFTEALNKRYGEARGLEDYARKAQMMTYEGERAMFEAYGRNKYDSTGVIQWMLNNAWPSMIWHLYDYYLRPGGGYFGAKKACEPLHIQYSYDDGSVVAVNSFYREFRGLKATAKLYNLDLTEKYSQQAGFDLAPDATKRLFVLPRPAGLTSTYFLRLTLDDAKGKPLSSNFYWLSTTPETLGKPKPGADWYYTPTKDFADFTALSTLPPAQVNVSAKWSKEGAEAITHVTIENTGKTLAFFVHLKITDGRDEILPVIWQDNYVSLMPGEKRELTAAFAAAPLRGAPPVVEVDGWNVAPKTWRQ
jgi:exo-1,4-beta-D-glucosaminidase